MDEPEVSASPDGTPMSVANAPCSYGAFEETIGFDPSVPEALRILDDVSNAGYSGIDLGPSATSGPPISCRSVWRPVRRASPAATSALSFGQPETLARSSRS